MKKFFITLIVSLCAMQSIVAQDVLITTDGDVMTVFIEDISSSTIYYKVENSENSSLQRIDKSKIYMIKKSDGTKIDLSSSSTQTEKATTTTQQMNTELSEAAKQRNKELIDAVNYAASAPESNELSDNRAVNVYATLGVDDNSIMCNDDIELSFETNGGFHILLIINNKSNRTIYIDQANTFFISSGESSPYYVPMAYSSSTSKTGDANAGSFAGAMGIHDYQTNISTNTVYSQRVVSIPPMSQKRLESKWLFPTRSHLCCPGVYFAWIKYGKQYYGQVYTRFAEGKKSQDILKNGETLNYSYGNSPLKFTFFVTYSFKEDCEITNSISLNLFIKKVIGYTTKGTAASFLLAVNYGSPEKVISDLTSTNYFIGIQTIDNTSSYYNFEGTVLKRP